MSHRLLIVRVRSGGIRIVPAVAGASSNGVMVPSSSPAVGVPYGAVAKNHQGVIGIVLGHRYDHKKGGKACKWWGVGIRGGIGAAIKSLLWWLSMSSNTLRIRSDMPKYRVYGTVTGTKYLGVVEADTMQEAEDKAVLSSSCYVSLCHQCCRECDDPEIHDVTAELVVDPLNDDDFPLGGEDDNGDDEEDA